MNKRIVEVIFILIGISFIAYPIISMCLASYNQTIAITNYKENVSNLSTEKKEEEFKKAREYNDSLKEITEIDLSLESSDTSNHISYLNVLNIGEIIGYITIPKINSYLPIYHGLSENVLQSGVGHLETTPLPIGGLGNHSVLAGHTGLSRTKIFDDIHKLVIGDKFYINILDEVLEYEVDRIDTVLPEETDAIKSVKDKDFITLITCTPYMINSHRLLVRGSRIEKQEEQIEEINFEVLKQNRKNNLIIIVIIFAVIIINIVFKIKNKKRVFAILIIIIGICIIIYPYLLREISKKQIKSDIDNFIGIVEKVRNEDMDRLYEKMVEYNRVLNEKGQSVNDAFCYETPSFNLTEYGLKENIIGTIKIPKIKIELPIYLGATSENLNKGIVHLSQTSLPLGEKNSNVVLAGHRSMVKHDMFKNIDKLDVGDKVILNTFWDTFIYKVNIKKVISPLDTSQILIQKNRDIITLITCHPYGTSKERYVVICERKG